jgi:hypothetical protein
VANKVRVDDKEYDVSELSDRAKSTIALLEFAERRIGELANMRALLQRAKISYVESLKREVISDKAGFIFGDD